MQAEHVRVLSVTFEGREVDILKSLLHKLDGTVSRTAGFSKNKLSAEEVDLFKKMREITKENVDH